MQKTFVKHSTLFLLLLIYINRGLFIAPNEAKNQNFVEINTFIEWAVQLVSGECNDIDEDGDMQSDCNFVTVFQHDFPQQLTLINLYSESSEKIPFLNTENILQKIFYPQIDHPPEHFS